jgi:phosphoesterase RecJ-like protein
VIASIDEIVRAIRGARKIFATTHIHPDGDALGSLFAMGEIVRSLGKEIYLYCEDDVPPLYDFLPGRGELHTNLPDLSIFDCAIALDCGDCFRMGQAREAVLVIKPFIVIDHHAGHKAFGDLRWIDAHGGATGEMVYELAGALGAELSYDAAYCLYTAVLSDTGSFRYASTSASTLRIAQELIAKGVRPDEVAGNLYDNFTVNRLELLRDVLSTLELFADQKIAVISMSREMIKTAGATDADSETFINYPRALKSVTVAAFIKEKEDGVIGVSLRSKGDNCDVATLSSSFGGGGHKNAAGFKMKDATIDSVKQALLAKIEPLILAAS